MLHGEVRPQSGKQQKQCSNTRENGQQTAEKGLKFHQSGHSAEQQVKEVIVQFKTRNKFTQIDKKYHPDLSETENKPPKQKSKLHCVLINYQRQVDHDLPYLYVKTCGRIPMDYMFDFTPGKMLHRFCRFFAPGKIFRHFCRILVREFVKMTTQQNRVSTLTC